MLQEKRTNTWRVFALLIMSLSVLYTYILIIIKSVFCKKTLYIFRAHCTLVHSMHLNALLGLHGARFCSNYGTYLLIFNLMIITLS